MKRVLYIGIVIIRLASPLPAETTSSIRLVLPDRSSPVVQNLGLLGYNTIHIGYPFHQFESFEDPASVVWLERYRVILAETKKFGLRVGIGMVPNGGFKNVPAELVKTPVPGAIRGNNFGEC